ncbi:MAG: MFS transporter [Chloroflexi bacterium]|nr:MFS transporter [Chloroflexota bacterium]
MMRSIAAFSAQQRTSTADTDRRRNLLAVSVASFLASVGFMVVMPVLPGLIREVTGDDPAAAGLWLGLAISVSPLLTALTGPIWAALGERYGRKSMIQRSLLCIGIGIGLMALAASPIHVVGLRAIIGGLGGVSVAALAAITATTPRRDLGPAVGVLQAAQTAGSMFGPLLGGLLGALVGMRESFVLAAVIFIVAIGLVQWLYREVPPLEETSARSGREPGRAASALGTGVVVALLAAFILQFVEGTFVVLMPLELERLGVDADALPTIYGIGLSVTYLAATVAAAAGGRLSGRWSPTTLMRGTLLVGVGLLLPLTLVSAWWHFVGLRVLLALVVGAGPTLAYAAAAAAASPERRAHVVSLASSAGILGWAASPLTAGALIQYSSALLLVINAALYVVLALVLLAYDRGLLDRLSLRLPAWPHALSVRPVLRPSLAGPRGWLNRLPYPMAVAGTLVRRPAQRYSVGEVVRALRGASSGKRTEAILDVAAEPARWLPSEPRRAFREVPRCVDRLPTILYLYRKGEDPEAIGRRLSPLGGRWPVERTVEIAADLIARHLNR